MASRGSQATAAGAGAGMDAPDHLPRRFGRYLLFDRIGRGGMADIYLARASTEIGVARRVVVKQILPELCADEHFARMLVDEAKLVAGLSHANVAQVLDLGREGDRLFITMEYVEGYDLNQLLRRLSKRRIPLPAEFALFVVREMLAALDFAHRAKGPDGEPLGIVHRDVSPSNVLISFEGEIKLCDFGIAKAASSATSTPKVSRVGGEDEATGERSRLAGKAAYMSPEHARGEAIDARADLFAAGIVLWELCAGRRLYKGTEEQMLELARAGEVPPLPDRGLPSQPELQALLDRALAVDPDERFRTAGEMLRALDEYAMGAKLFASQLRFASFMQEHFEADVVRARRERERAAEALDRGPPVEMEPLDEPDAPARHGEDADRDAERALEPPRTEAPAADEGPTDAQRRLAEDTTKRLSTAPPEASGGGLGLALGLGVGALALAAVLLWLLFLR
ncbi:MAG TPA: serine/threonine-protein kinase [Sandaracinaceae bacterium LLY-WYZ-13_1]|nr:serine/threonine-protein kinase [Sandaracinaceae bacterium LLY-WYZ-13_1]